MFCRVFGVKRSCLLSVEIGCSSYAWEKREQIAPPKASLHVYRYFRKEIAKNKYRGALKLTSRTAEATGYSEHTVRRIVAEKTELDGSAFTSPLKCYRRERKRIDPDHFDTEALRCNVHEFYCEKNYPTLDMLLVAVKVNDKQYIYEQARIIVQRHEHLRRLRRNRRKHRPVVYLDETWTNVRDGVEKMWVEDDLKVVGARKVVFVSRLGRGVG